jgi:uncharacterized protein
MPLFLKIQVIQHHRIIYTKNRYELYEYFYNYRRIWNDEKQRQTMTKKEISYIFS